MPSSQSVLFVTPECAPLVKTGGLGDVSAALPAALHNQGVDVRVLIPGYPTVMSADPSAREAARVRLLGHEVRLLESRLPNDVPLLVAACPELYTRGGGPYQADDGADWKDNAMRFGVLSKLAALLGSDGSPLRWRPQVVHCNDWPTALAPVYLQHSRQPRAASLVTIHNLAFQGLFERVEVSKLELPAAVLGHQGLEFFGKISFLKGGLVYADAVNTVSPTYAQEIQGQKLGFGMEGVLRVRADRLYGVLNGIDTELWDPSNDAHIPSGYDAASLEKKAANKVALRERMGLDAAYDRPVAGLVSRLTHQKGIDFLLDAADALLTMGWQVAVVGTGERELVTRLEAAQRQNRGQFAVWIGFDESLAHLIEAGSDVFLMPSRFEPCGMNQMYSQRYGTPPIVNATGGLVDTVTEDRHQTGFVMTEANSAQLIAACRRAMEAIKDEARWRRIQRNGMERDFSWGPAAKKYREIYSKITPTS